MRFAALGTLAMGLVGALTMGCSPSAKAPASPPSRAGTTTLTNTLLPSADAPKELLLPDVKPDDALDGPNDFDGNPRRGTSYARLGF